MNGIAIFLVSAATVGWGAVALVPALRELMRPRDARALEVVGRDTADLAYFARQFQTYIAPQIPTSLPDTLPYQITLNNGQTAWLLGENDLLAPLANGNQEIDYLIVTPAAYEQQQPATLMRELYAQNSYSGAPDSTYRALLCMQELVLAERTTVLRWAHAHGPLYAASGSHLYGRATSDTALHLAADVHFQHLAAPRILVAGKAAPPAAITASTVINPATIGRAQGDHRRVDGDLTLAAGARLTSNLVVRGNLTVDACAYVRGDVKVYGTVHLHPNSIVDGSLTARNRITLAPYSCVAGPLIAEQELDIAGGCRVGFPHTPTTLSAPQISLGPGCFIYGVIHAAQAGWTVK